MAVRHNCARLQRELPAAIPYASEEETIAIDVDSEFSLGDTVWVSNADHGLVRGGLSRRDGRVRRERFHLHVGASFGGVKGSGPRRSCRRRYTPRIR